MATKDKGYDTTSYDKRRSRDWTSKTGKRKGRKIPFHWEVMMPTEKEAKAMRKARRKGEVPRLGTPGSGGGWGL